MQSITLTVLTDVHLTEPQAGAAAHAWAQNAGVALVMYSTDPDTPWLSVVGGIQTPDTADPVQLLGAAVRGLVLELGAVGAGVARWLGVELVDVDELNRRRGTDDALPATVDAGEFGELAGLTRQRIQQYESDRGAGKRADFPAPVLPGRWLRSDAALWAATRRTKPGPVPKAGR